MEENSEKNNDKKNDRKRNWKDISKGLNFLKIAGFIWFHGELPKKYDPYFPISFYPFRMEEVPPEGLQEIQELGGDAMGYLSKNMTVPTWIMNENLYKKFDLSDMEELLCLFG